MRKFMVGLMVGGLLAVTAPAIAQAQVQAQPQQAGIGDPLTLAASGVLIPFLGGTDVSLLEIASPVGDNSGVHMLFFDATCARIGDSVGLPLTTNDIGFVQIPTVASGSGLITIGQVDATGFNLLPLDNPIHTRVYVFNSVTARSRVLDPIILDTAEFSRSPISELHTWSALRTSSTFYAPQQTATVTTDLIFICPSTTIQDRTDPNKGAFPFGNTSTGAVFPRILVGSPDDFAAGTAKGGLAPSFPTDMLRARIYNTNEVFLRDVRTTCACVRSASVLDISSVYSTADAVLGTYTELEANPANSASFDFAFTGYKNTASVGSAVNIFTGRLSNGSRASIQGTLTDTR